MNNLTTRQRVEGRIKQTTGQHTRWLYFDDREGAWFNGSDFVCQMNRWDLKDGTPATDAEGNGKIMRWAACHQLLTDNQQGETEMTKACEDCGVQIPTIQLGVVCSPCMSAYVDKIVEEASGVTATTL